MEQISSNVPPQFVNWLIVEYLAVRFNYLSREAWAEWVTAGKVHRNGQLCTLETVVTSGDVVTCAMPEWSQPFANLDYQIVYEDEWLLGINKPPHLRVHSGGKFLKMNLIYQLKFEHQPPYPDADLINRLDAGTSGVVLVGKNREAIQKLSQMFWVQEVKKEYAAVVHGVPAEKTGRITFPIGKVPGTKVRFGTTNATNHKEASTRYEVMETAGEKFAWLTLWPETGRTHQLRVHTAALGHPMVGDVLYRSVDDPQFWHWCSHPEEFADTALITRQALHCTQTSFVHPITGEMCVISAAVAPDMVQMWEKIKHEQLA